MLGLGFALVLCWYLICIVKAYASMTLHYYFLLIIFILHSPGLIANATIIFNTPDINQYIVRGLFSEHIATALRLTNLRVNEEYTSSTTYILTHSFVNICIFWKSPQLYTCSVLNYIPISFYLFSRLDAGHFKWKCVQENTS